MLSHILLTVLFKLFRHPLTYHTTSWKSERSCPLPTSETSAYCCALLWCMMPHPQLGYGGPSFILVLRLSQSLFLLLTSLIPHSSQAGLPLTNTFWDLFSIWALAISGPWPGTWSLTSLPVKSQCIQTAQYPPYRLQALLLLQLPFSPVSACMSHKSTCTTKKAPLPLQQTIPSWQFHTRFRAMCGNNRKRGKTWSLLSGCLQIKAGGQAAKHTLMPIGRQKIEREEEAMYRSAWLQWGTGDVPCQIILFL